MTFYPPLWDDRQTFLKPPLAEEPPSDKLYLYGPYVPYVLTTWETEERQRGFRGGLSTQTPSQPSPTNPLLSPSSSEQKRRL